MKKLRIILAVAAITLLASCSVSGPLMITDNDVSTKRGEASYNVWIFGIRPIHADASIRTAAKNGGITKVATVDAKVRAGFLKSTYTTIVTGE